MERIQVVLTDLPVTVRGLTVYYYDEDGVGARDTDEMVAKFIIRF